MMTIDRSVGVFYGVSLVSLIFRLCNVKVLWTGPFLYSSTSHVMDGIRDPHPE